MAIELVQGSGEWLPLPEAARRLGVSADTLRKRVTAGKYEAKKDDSNGRWLVRLTEEDLEDASPSDQKALMVLLDQVEWLRAEVDKWRGQIDERDARIEALQERVPYTEAVELVSEATVLLEQIQSLEVSGVAAAVEGIGKAVEQVAEQQAALLARLEQTQDATAKALERLEDRIAEIQKPERRRRWWPW